MCHSCGFQSTSNAVVQFHGPVPSQNAGSLSAVVLHRLPKLSFGDLSEDLIGRVLVFDRNAWVSFQRVSRDTHKKIIALLKSNRTLIYKEIREGNLFLCRSLAADSNYGSLTEFYQALRTTTSDFGKKWRGIKCPPFPSLWELKALQSVEDANLLVVWKILHVIIARNNPGPDLPGPDGEPAVIRTWMQRNKNLCRGVEVNNFPLTELHVTQLEYLAARPPEEDFEGRAREPEEDLRTPILFEADDFFIPLGGSLSAQSIALGIPGVDRRVVMKLVQACFVFLQEAIMHDLVMPDNRPVRVPTNFRDNGALPFTIELWVRRSAAETLPEDPSTVYINGTNTHVSVWLHRRERRAPTE